MPQALLRAVPDSFTEAIRHGDGPPIDVATARRQHEAYQTVLAEAGYSVMVLPADEVHPDCPFIEDTMVILEDTAVATRPGVESRRGEVGPVARALEGRLAVATITEPATLDGGDVLRMGNTVFVGRSQRTNQQGIDRLLQITSLLGFRLRPVSVSGALHLKSAVLRLDDSTVLLSIDQVSAEVFGDYRVIPKALGEEDVASVLPLTDGTVMATASAPQTIADLERAGYKVVPIDISQFQAADGGLTCLSLLL
jgi:dimethylargininase